MQPDGDTAHSVTQGSGLESDRCHHDPLPPFVGEEVYDRASRSGYIVDLFNWIGSSIRFLPNLSFVFIAYFICAHFQGASCGTRQNGGT